MAGRWDNLEIVRTIDRLQGQQNGAALWINGLNLMEEITGQYAVNQELVPGFVQELHIARDAGLLTFALSRPAGNSRAADPAREPHLYLQEIRDFALTVAGQDRARGRVIAQQWPEPGEDDGRLISALILQTIAACLAEEYAPDQVAVFLREAGVPPRTLSLPPQVPAGDAYAALLFLAEGAGSEGRRALRTFIGHWLEDRLPSGPDDQTRTRLADQLARQGWHVRDGRLVIGERATGGRVAAPLLRDARLAALHPAVLEVAETFVRDGHLATAVLEALKAVNLRVKTMADRQEDGRSLMGAVFSSDKPVLVLGDLSTETGRNVQEGYRFLLMGAMVGIRNPLAHEQFTAMQQVEVFELLGLASNLMRALDRATLMAETQTPSV